MKRIYFFDFGVQTYDAVACLVSLLIFKKPKYWMMSFKFFYIYLERITVLLEYLIQGMANLK